MGVMIGEPIEGEGAGAPAGASSLRYTAISPERMTKKLSPGSPCLNKTSPSSHSRSSNFAHSLRSTGRSSLESTLTLRMCFCTQFRSLVRSLSVRSASTFFRMVIHWGCIFSRRRKSVDPDCWVPWLRIARSSSRLSRAFGQSEAGTEPPPCMAESNRRSRPRRLQQTDGSNPIFRYYDGILSKEHRISWCKCSCFAPNFERLCTRCGMLKNRAHTRSGQLARERMLGATRQSRVPLGKVVDKLAEKVRNSVGLLRDALDVPIYSALHSMPQPRHFSSHDCLPSCAPSTLSASRFSLSPQWSVDYLTKARDGDTRAMMNVAELQFYKGGFGKLAYNPVQGQR